MNPRIFLYSWNLIVLQIGQNLSFATIIFFFWQPSKLISDISHSDLRRNNFENNLMMINIIYIHLRKFWKLLQNQSLKKKHIYFAFVSDIRQMCLSATHFAICLAWHSPLSQYWATSAKLRYYFLFPKLWTSSIPCRNYFISCRVQDIECRSTIRTQTFLNQVKLFFDTVS